MKQNTLFSLRKWLFVGLCKYTNMESEKYFLESNFCSVNETICMHSIITWFWFVLSCIWKWRNRYCIKWIKTKPLNHFKIDENEYENEYPSTHQVLRNVLVEYFFGAVFFTFEYATHVFCGVFALKGALGNRIHFNERKRIKLRLWFIWALTSRIALA